MDRSDRKAAVAAYKERKGRPGVYVVRCAATGEQWVGSAPDLTTIWARRSFALRQGADSNKTLQKAWTNYGPERFVFEVLEEIDLEKLVYALDLTLKERREHWREMLGATPI
jgi:hypothetical protein